MPLVSMRQLLDHAAENGYGVLASLPSPGPSEAIAWLVRLFGPEREVEISARLADVLGPVLCLDASGPTDCT